MAVIRTAQWANSTTPQIELEVVAGGSTATAGTFDWTLRYVAHGYAASTGGQARDWTVQIGSTVKRGTFDINGITGTKVISSGSVTIQRTTSAQTPKIACAMAFNLTWSGVYGGVKSATGTISLAAKTSYTITYNANGGSGAPGKQTKWYGTNIKLSTSKPTRSGRTFSGWATSANGAVVYQPGDTYSANASVTLYAVWDANTFTVSYDANGGTGAPGNQIKTYGVNLILSTVKPTRSGYGFRGWGLSANSTTVSYQPGSTYTKNASVKLYALWNTAYKEPRINGLTVDRCTSSGSLSDDGTYARVAFTWVTDGNILNIKITCNGSTRTLTPSGTYGSVLEVVGSGGLDTEYEYPITITVTDALGLSTTISTTVAPMIFLLDCLAGGKGLALGKPASRAGLDIGFDVYFDLYKSLYAGSSRFLRFLSSGRPVFENHTGLANAIWLQGETTSGSFTNLLRMNGYNEVELNWTSGGLKGRVMKSLWSGTFSGGSISVSELAYYNVIAVTVSDSAGDASGTKRVILFRSTSNVFAGVNCFMNGSDVRILMVQLSASGASLSYGGVAMCSFNAGGFNNLLINRKIYEIYGIL